MQVLINAAVATNATKVQFELNSTHFQRSSLPAIKTAGLGTDDSVTIYENINGVWEVGKVLTSTDPITIIRSVGDYAVDITMATAGPVSVVLTSSYD